MRRVPCAQPAQRFVSKMAPHLILRVEVLGVVWEVGGVTGSDKCKAGKEEVSHMDPGEGVATCHGGPWGGTRVGRAFIGVSMAKARRG